MGNRQTYRQGKEEVQMKMTEKNLKGRNKTRTPQDTSLFIDR